MELFGTHAEKPVYRLKLKNDDLACELITYGAAVRSLTVPDRDGKLVDVVLGFDTLEEYVSHDCYFGAIVGPMANRIGGATCLVGGKRLQLTKNDGENNLHSGAAGLNCLVWDVVEQTENAATLICTHPDCAGGIPGDLRVAVRYCLEDRSLIITYWAVSDRDTLCNLTNHSYFNLDGHDAGPITNHRVTLFSHSFTPTDAASIPTGEIRAVAGTPMDLTHGTLLSERIDADYDQLRDAGGYDRNWLIDPNDQGVGFRPAALVKGGTRGITMAVYTDRPCVQFYSGNYIPNGLPGKDGAVYNRRQGLCLETQGFPDAPNHASFPSVTLKAGRAWESCTEYRFC